MLAAMAYNENRGAEMRDDRRVSVVYQSFSKLRGEKGTKMKKSLANEDWKKDIVEKSLERKQQIGMGKPVDPDQDEIDEDLDIVIDKFDELLNFSDTHDDFVGINIVLIVLGVRHKFSFFVNAPNRFFA
jgi:hypothetical protein